MNLFTADAIRRELRLGGPKSAARLAALLQVSQPTLSRRLRSLSDEIVVGGAARSTRYALRRPVDGLGSASLPIYEVGAESTRRLGLLVPVHPGGFRWEAAVGESEWLDDLPWWMSPLRPAGFLGRQLPALHPELQLPPDIVRWTSDHVLRYQAWVGWDSPGALLVGDGALARLLDAVRVPVEAFSAAEVNTEWPLRAELARRGPSAGSSAAGEQPKFLAARRDGSSVRHVLVKYSPPLSTDAGRRWADLLVCEHLALATLRDMGIDAAWSDVVEAGGRVFLEVERFDRVGERGRRGAVDMMAAVAWEGGPLTTWTSAAGTLRGVLSREDQRRIRLADAFGALIANTDRHLGNLSLWLDGSQPSGLAPLYDMLPMAFAPRGAELPDPAKPIVGPVDAEVAGPAITAAFTLWDAVRNDRRVSSEFVDIAETCLREVEGIERAARWLAR